MTVSSTEAAGSPAVDTNTQDVNTAESSAADQGVKSSLDAVNAALGEQEASPTSNEQAPKEPDPKTPPVEKPADLSEDDQKLSKGAQRRIRELVEDRKTVEAQVTPLRQEVEALKPKAEQFEQISGFMREHSISQDHLNNALGLTAMLNKGEFDRALPILENLLNSVREQAGEVLPGDLLQRVNLGYITEADAKALHKARTDKTRIEQRTARERQGVEGERQQREHNDMVQRSTTAADKWSTEQATSDPDWNQKRDLVTKQMKLMLHDAGPAGFPRTEQDVRKLLDQAKKDVESDIGRFRPALRPIDVVTGGSVSPRSAAKPTSVMDAVNQGLANAHRG